MNGYDLLARTDAPPARNSPEERRRARLVVAWNALDAADARDLLEALGLLEEVER